MDIINIATFGGQEKYYFCIITPYSIAIGDSGRLNILNKQYNVIDNALDGYHSFNHWHCKQHKSLSDHLPPP
jgi:hypothetical protein